MVVLFAMTALAPVGLAMPQQGDSFSYDFVQEVTNGQGGYEGWWEKTTSHGRYDVVSTEGEKTEILFNYKWSYDSYDSKTGPQSVSGNFSFSTATRKYIYGYDLDVAYGANPSIWFWVPPSISVGQQLVILDQEFTVRSKSAVVWSDWLPREAIELVAYGSGHRNDAYGNFAYTFRDEYYMDKETGYIIAERYEEQDTGSWQGASSSFTWKESYDVTSSSYERQIEWISLSMIILGIIGTAALLYLAYYAIRWRKRTVVLDIGNTVKIFRIRKISKFPHLANEASMYFGDFLEDFARKALLSGGRVAVAVSKTGLAGLAVYHRDVKTGAIFCKSFKVNEPLRKYIGAKDFFSEVKHEMEGDVSTYDDWGTNKPLLKNVRAYNIFETSKVLTLSSIPQLPYDASTIRVMAQSDLEEVSAIAQKVYKVKAKRWMQSLLDTKDIGVVAVVGGRIVGFAFATLTGDRARFHTLTVAPELRGRGLAKEMMRARLHIVRELGVREVVLEIADWNLASLTVSTFFGFRSIGEMYVETMRTKRVKKDIVRRW